MDTAHHQAGRGRRLTLLSECLVAAMTHPLHLVILVLQDPLKTGALMAEHLQHTRACTHACMHTRTHTHACTHTHTRMHAHTYTHARTHTQRDRDRETERGKDNEEDFNFTTAVRPSLPITPFPSNIPVLLQPFPLPLLPLLSHPAPPLTLPQALQWCRRRVMVKLTVQAMHMLTQLSGSHAGAYWPRGASVG